MKLGFLFSGLFLFTCSFAQFEPPELFFREDWNKLPPYDIIAPYTVSQSDVMNGGRSLACSRIDWIEVYAGSVKK